MLQKNDFRTVLKQMSDYMDATVLDEFWRCRNKRDMNRRLILQSKLLLGADDFAKALRIVDNILESEGEKISAKRAIAILFRPKLANEISRRRKYSDYQPSTFWLKLLAEKVTKLGVMNEDVCTCVHALTPFSDRHVQMHIGSMFKNRAKAENGSRQGKSGSRTTKKVTSKVPVSQLENLSQYFDESPEQLVQLGLFFLEVDVTNEYSQNFSSLS